MIVIEDLEKYYEDKKVLSDISLHIKEGEIHGLIGMSGSGKSTLLRTINGIESINKGNIQVLGQDMQKLKGQSLLNLRREMGMIFQDFALLNRKNVYDNIALPLKCWNYGQEEIKKRVLDLVELVGIEDKIYQYPLNLSGGQRQRVAIARALALEPKILLSDEATSGLDPITTDNILKLLLDINQKIGITIVLVTHEMDIVRKICDHMSILEDGKIIKTGKVEEFYLNFDKSFMKLTENISLEKLDSSFIKIVKFNEKYDSISTNFIGRLESCLNFTIEKASIENLKNGKLEQYYISINKSQEKRALEVLGKFKNINFKIL